ncbi:hypothetical protein ACJX0J_016527, partial [Zea mays]
DLSSPTGSLPGARSRRRRRSSAAPAHARTVRPSGREPELMRQVADRLALCRGPQKTRPSEPFWAGLTRTTDFVRCVPITAFPRPVSELQEAEDA